jgi:hypothetical protein
MTSPTECRSHAALCTQLAKQDPANRFVWSAEAKYWGHLSKQRHCRQTRTTITLVAFRSLTAKIGGLSSAHRRNDVDASVVGATMLVRLTGFLVSVPSHVVKWLRRDGRASTARPAPMQRPLMKNDQIHWLSERYSETPIWLADSLDYQLVGPQRTKNQTAHVRTSKSGQSLVELS